MEKLRGNKGFTLIEIIAVLIILGILAAVAIPKFLDMQEEAKRKSADGIIAAAQSQLSMAYAQAILNQDGDENAAWTALDGAAECAKVQIDSYTDPILTCTKTGNVVGIAASVDGSADATGNFHRMTQ